MLEKKRKRLSKKVGVFALILSLLMCNGVLAFAKTISGSFMGIKYTYKGNAIQSGKTIKTTGSTEADISLKKKSNYVEVHACMEFTNGNGVTAIDTVKTVKRNVVQLEGELKKKATLPAQSIPKELYGKAVTARVGHDYASSGVSAGTHTIY